MVDDDTENQSTLSTGGSLQTVNGAYIQVTAPIPDIMVSDGTVNTTATELDVQPCNGIIYSIDVVLQPPTLGAPPPPPPPPPTGNHAT